MSNKATLTQKEFMKFIEQFTPQPINCPFTQISQCSCGCEEITEIDKQNTIHQLLISNLIVFAQTARKLSGLMEQDSDDIVNSPDVVEAYPFKDTFEEVVRKIEQWDEVFTKALSDKMWRY